MDLSDWKAKVLAAIKQIFETAVIASTDIAAAFNQMSGNKCTGDLVEVGISIPALYGESISLDPDT